VRVLPSCPNDSYTPSLISVRRMKAYRLGLPLWALASASLLNCSGDKAPARGQIMLALRTDMALPKDISRIKLQVLDEQGKVKFDKPFTVGADGEAKIPATFAIVAPEGQSPTVEVRVVGFNASGPRTFNKVVTTVPSDRVAVLHMPIQWLCDKTVLDLGADSYESKCAPIGEDETSCVAGTCQKVSVREDSLPTFAPPDVFGGGERPEDPSGKCFDTVACFTRGLRVYPDAACRVSLVAPATRALNFALRPTAADEGICGTDHDCFIPLDKSDIYGWKELGAGASDGAGGAGGAASGGADAPAGGGAAGEASLPDFGGSGAKVRTFELPPAICQKLSDGVIASVQATAVCETKTERLPVCGDWYSTVAERVTPTQPGSGDGTTCPEFKAGANVGDVTGEPLFDGMLQAAADFKAQADALAKSTFSACAGVVTELGGSAPMAPATLTAAAVKAACDSARAALISASSDAADSSWSVLLAPGQCGFSLDQQATCESTCKTNDCGTLPKEVDRCADLGGNCSNLCSGACGGTAAQPAACSGTCQGVCTGTCQGQCIQEDGSLATGSCDGWCTGSCEGTCTGLCAVEEQSCDGTCWVKGAECAGTLDELYCRVPLDTESCLGTCGTLCAAEATLDQRCDATSAKVFGVAPDALRSAIDKYYAALADTVARSTGVTAAAGFIQELYASFAMASDGKDAHAAACLTAAGNAVGSASGIVTAALDGAVSSTRAVSAGRGSTDTCSPVTSDDACLSCIKSSCCDAYSACVAPDACATGGPSGEGELACALRCYAGPSQQQTSCLASCRMTSSATFSDTTDAVVSCASDSCATDCNIAVCSGSEVSCDGNCTDLDSDLNNCGACGRACVVGQTCVGGQCACATNRTLCGSSCVDRRTDAANCGECGMACATGYSCSGGTCLSSTGSGGAGGQAGSSGAGGPSNGGASSAGASAVGGGVAGVGGTAPIGGIGGAGAPSTNCPPTVPQTGEDCTDYAQSTCSYAQTTCTCPCIDGCTWGCPQP
jgi:hypothetical protein